MSAEFLILDNEKAAKLFSQSGYDAVPEEVFPVKLERVVFRKTYTESVWPAGSWRCITKAFFCGWIPEKFLSGPDIVPALD